MLKAEAIPKLLSFFCLGAACEPHSDTYLYDQLNDLSETHYIIIGQNQQKG